MRSYLIGMKGVVVESLPEATFRVQLDNGSEILGETSRRMRKSYIPVSAGDRVKVELTSFDAPSCRITDRIPTQKVLS